MPLRFRHVLWTVFITGIATVGTFARQGDVPPPGSTRHAQVAIPMADGRKPLTVLLSRMSEEDCCRRRSPESMSRGSGKPPASR